MKFGNFGGESTPKLCSKYLSVKYLLISKNTGTLCGAIEKTDIWGGRLGGPQEGAELSIDIKDVAP